MLVSSAARQAHEESVPCMKSYAAACTQIALPRVRTSHALGAPVDRSADAEKVSAAPCTISDGRSSATGRVLQAIYKPEAPGVVWGEATSPARYNNILPPAGQHSRLKAWRHRWHEAHGAVEDACGRVLPRPAGRSIMPGPVRHISSCTVRRRRPIVTSAASGSQAAVIGRPQLAAGEQPFKHHLTGGAADRLSQSAGGGSICGRPGTSAGFDRAAYSSAVGRAHRAADLGISADTRASSSISTDARVGSGCC